MLNRNDEGGFTVPTRLRSFQHSVLASSSCHLSTTWRQQMHFPSQMPDYYPKNRSRCRSNVSVLHHLIWHRPSGHFSQQHHHHHQPPSTESSTITSIHSQPQYIFHATLSSTFINRTACPRNNGISSGPSRGLQHPNFQVGLELNFRTAKHGPSQLPT